MSAGVFRRYLNLLAMEERGTKHESVTAAEKISRLKKRYDVDAPPKAPEETAEDLFSEAKNIHPDASLRSLIVFKMEDSSVGNLVKWVITEAFNVKSVWRSVSESTQTELFVGAKKEDIPHLRHIAHVINERFNSLWEHFRATTSADAGDEPSFHIGLYDGLMRDPRKPGQGTPMRAPKRTRKQTRKKAPRTDDKSIRPHAYSVALELGAQIRLNRSMGDITSILDGLLGLENTQHQ